MALDNFRTQKIIWDKANRKIFEAIEANAGDSNGRKLVVQIINQETTESLSGTTLSLGWKSRNGAKGLDAFNVVDASKGIFEIYYTTEMLSNIGNLEASLILINSTGRIESSTFTISVRPSTVDDESVESENSFTALTEALVKVSDFDAQLAQTKDELKLKADDRAVRKKSQPITLNDLDSEVLGVIQNGSGGTPINIESVPRDNSVTPYKTDFFKFNKNLFNPKKATLNKLVSPSNGNVTDIENFSITEFIQIEPNTPYSWSLKYSIAFYDDSKNFISGTVGESQSFTITSPENARYVVTGFQSKYTDKLQIERGSVSTDYEAYKAYIPIDNIDDKIADDIEMLKASNDDKVAVKYTNNLYNPEALTVGEVEIKAIGAEQIIPDLGRGLVSQKIAIDRTKGLSFKGIRIYSLVDKNNVITKPGLWVPVADTFSLTSAQIPPFTTHAWVTSYPSEAPQVENSETLSKYEPYGIEGLYVGDFKISDYQISSGGVSDSFFNELLYESSLAKLNHDELLEVNRFLEANALAGLNSKDDKISIRSEINLRKTDKQKMILHLHKRNNNGYDTKNDVYLPNAEDDFSDVKIMTDDGTPLAYRTMFYADDFDVVADARLGINNGSKTLVNSRGTIFQTVGAVMCTSEDMGATWQPIESITVPSPTLNLITDDDTMYFNRLGVLYRSEYPYENFQEVLDTRENYTGTFIHVNSMVQHPDGEIFAGSYQNEWHIRIYKSTDNGLNWEICYENLEKYQHVHSMYIDTSVNPVAIYAGTDGGGGVLKTVDKGNTWQDLRATGNNMPQSTDFGVIYADPSGYRLLGGETSIVGGYSIIKTTDDLNYKPVLGNGSGVACARKLNNLIFAGGAGANASKNAILYMSRDKGETWEGVYTTGAIDETNGANDGFRYLSNVEDQIFVSTQSISRSPLRILPEGKYAEIIVDVPEGTEKIIVEDGHSYPYETPIVNDTEIKGNVLFNFNFNENGEVIKEDVSGTLYKGEFEWVKVGKQLANFYPPIVSAKDEHSLLISSTNGFEVDSFDATSGFTLTFWARLTGIHRENVIETDNGSIIDFNNHQMNYNGSNLMVYKFPAAEGVTEKYDIVFFPNGSVKSYTNGQLRFESSNNVSYAQALIDITNSQKLVLLRPTVKHADNFIQHFSIRKGVVPEVELYEEYNSYLKDNVGD